ncbi:hypothetical protein ABJ384_05055 [Acinetobacter sp. A1-4-2]|uniref:Uncharacterized protein n=1 Tax=Acinetobacter sp. A1-4-2 TaxID=3156489 RepID=A0AAU7T055_9GAMM
MLEQISYKQRGKEISGIILFWMRLVQFNYYFDHAGGVRQQPNKAQKIGLDFLSKLYEFNLSKAYGEDNSDFFRDQILASFHRVLEDKKKQYHHLSASLISVKLKQASAFPFYTEMRLIDAQIEYPALFAKAVDQHTIPFIKIDFPKGNIDLKTLSFFDQQLTIPDQFIDEMDRRIIPFQAKLDTCFKHSQSIKFISLKLLYIDPIYNVSADSNNLNHAKERCQKHLQFFRAEIRDIEGLLTHFDKIEFGINYCFNIFAVFCFKNTRSETIASIEEKIRRVWESTFYDLTEFERCTLVPGLELQTKPYCVRVQNYQWDDFETDGILKKDSVKYKKFVRTTLNYFANQTELFTVNIAGHTLEAGYYSEFETAKDQPVLAKTAVKQKRNTVHKPYSAHQKIYADLLKKSKLSRSVAGQLAEIQHCYNFLIRKFEIAYPFNLYTDFQWLVKIEMFVYLAGEWKQSLYQPLMVNRPIWATDLNQIYEHFFAGVSFRDIYTSLKRLLEEYGCIFSTRVLVGFLALQLIEEKQAKFHMQVMRPNEIKHIFVENIRSLLAGTLDELYDYGKALDQIGVSVLSRFSYINHTLKKKALSTVRENEQHQGQSVVQWLNSQSRQSKKEYRTYLNYWDEMQAYQGTHVLVTLLIGCDNFIEHFTIIDSTIRKAIDRLQKVGQPEIYAYLGHWTIIQCQSAQPTYKLTLLFSIDSNYTDYDEQTGELGRCFKALFLAKLRMLFDKYNDEKTNGADHLSIDISQSRLDDVAFQTLEEDQKKLKEILQSWFYEVSRYFQYFVLTPIADKKNIKGIRKSKRRVKNRNKN